MLVTNGDYIGVGPDAGQIRKYKVIHEYNSEYWVKQMNGNYVGETLIFLFTMSVR